MSKHVVFLNFRIKNHGEAVHIINFEEIAYHQGDSLVYHHGNAVYIIIAKADTR